MNASVSSSSPRPWSRPRTPTSPWLTAAWDGVSEASAARSCSTSACKVSTLAPPVRARSISRSSCSTNWATSSRSTGRPLGVAMTILLLRRSQSTPQSTAGRVTDLAVNSMTMNLLHDNAPLALVILGWIVVVPWAVQSAVAARRQFLPSPLAEHAWLGAIVATAFLWELHVRSPVGLDFGLLGGALFALVFGRARAILGLLAAFAPHT